jgi:transposase
MMGTHQPQSELFNYQVNLEKRVRVDHPLRRIEAVLDLGFVRPAVERFYGRNGQVGVDPEVLMKMLLLLFLDDVASERELMAIIPERLDYLWFLGYGLDEPVPNHSVLSKARARWGKEVFADLFVRTVEQCVTAGLVDGKKLHIDSSLVRADAARESIMSSAPEVVAALRQAYQAQEQKLTERPANATEPVPAQADRVVWLQEHCQPVPKAEAPPGPVEEPRPPEPSGETINSTRVSHTDPEATLAKASKSGLTQLSYKHHRAVDNRHGVITALKTTTGEAGDAAQLAPLVQQHRANTGTSAMTAVGDKHYGTAENYRYSQAQNIGAHLGQAPAARRDTFAVSEFVYEPQQDRYRCPAGHYLYYRAFKKAEQLIEYRIEMAALCVQCPLRAKCTTSANGRTVTRPQFSELVEAGRQQARSPSARADFARRKHLMEGSFADASNNHGFKRARWRGLWRQQIQDWLIAAVQNLRILINQTPRCANEGEKACAVIAGQQIRRWTHCLSVFLALPEPSSIQIITFDRRPA